MSRTKLKATLVPRPRGIGGFEPGEEAWFDVSLTPVTREARNRTTTHDQLGDLDGLPLEGDVVGGHYRLVRRLGEGTFGRVYVAERTDVCEHRVALKVMSREVYGRRNVERELTMLAAASHPHIVQLKDHGVTEEYVWLTMPLYEGETLEERLTRGCLSLREAYEIFLPIARGVQALHERGLRHQDVKPENIYLAQFSGRVHPVVLDLGVAVEKNATFVAGTALFGAPEQLAALAGVPAKLVLSEKMDTYGLASTLLYALVGEGFFPGVEAESPYDIANAFEERERMPLREGAIVGLVGLPRDALANALTRWLLRDPDERPSVASMADELTVLLEQERAEARALELAAARQKRALARVRVALGALLMGAAGLLLWGYTKRQTLRLASELERARAEGARGFDELDVCVAAHELSRQETRECRAQSDTETELHASALETLRTEHGKREGELESRAATAAEHLEECVDTAREASEKHTALLASERAASQAELARIDAERQRSEEQRAVCETTLTTTQADQGECKQDLAACVLVRDLCMDNQAPAPEPAPLSPPDGPGRASSAPQG
jgi:hypothetical protein